MGIEPTNVGTTIRCVNHFATTAIMVEGGRFELPNPKERIYSPPRLATSLPLHINEKWLRTESNRRHKDFQSFALPTELLSLKICIKDSRLTTGIKMAVRTGLEPATSCVTGRHSNQLNYRTRVFSSIA